MKIQISFNFPIKIKIKGLKMYKILWCRNRVKFFLNTYEIDFQNTIEANDQKLSFLFFFYQIGNEIFDFQTQIIHMLNRSFQWSLKTFEIYKKQLTFDNIFNVILFDSTVISIPKKKILFCSDHVSHWQSVRKRTPITGRHNEDKMKTTKHSVLI